MIGSSWAVCISNTSIGQNVEVMAQVTYQKYKMCILLFYLRLTFGCLWSIKSYHKVQLWYPHSPLGPIFSLRYRAVSCGVQTQSSLDLTMGSIGEVWTTNVILSCAMSRGHPSVAGHAPPFKLVSALVPGPESLIYTAEDEWNFHRLKSQRGAPLIFRSHV